MGNSVKKLPSQEQSSPISEQHPAAEKSHPVTSRSASVWSPAYNEYCFGDSPDDVNNKLPNPFDTVDWDTLPIAYEYKEDHARYFFVAINEFFDPTKFAPPHSYISPSSRACFLFKDKKLFRISIRMIHDDRASNYKDITEAYARAVNTPVLTDGTFHYEDDRIFYYAFKEEDCTVVETILKGCVKPDGNVWNPYPKESTLEKMQKLSLVTRSSYDIIISYCHQDKEVCLKIHKQLPQSGFKVWIDLENMYGSTVTRMAEAIENSQYVLICMSEKYKSSSYCQLEAEYAFKSQRCFIPLIVEKNYRPTGWLGMLTGLRMYVDFTKYDFALAYSKLLIELQRNRREE